MSICFIKGSNREKFLLISCPLSFAFIRKLRETISNALSPTPLLSYIASLQNGLWPNGELKEPSKPRTSKEKAELRESANKKLSTFIPGEYSLASLEV